MPLLQAGPRTYDVDLIIFDKDGTLFDFKAMWARLFLEQLDRIRLAAGASDELCHELVVSMGIDPERGEVDPLGPLALATYEEIRVIMALVLYRHGRPWDQAMRVADEIMDAGHWPPLSEMVQPIGDVAGLFRRLSEAGLRIGIVTIDEREMTRAMLKLIGADGPVSAMVCADDGVPLKPAPDGILALCRQVGVSPGRALMVGDSPTDLQAARAAGLAGGVGVTSGVSRREDLEPLADVILSSIHELKLA